MNYQKFVKKQKELFLNGFERVNRNRHEWQNFNDRVKATYNPLLSELKLHFQFDFFYLIETKDIPHKKEKENQNFITLYMGSHPTGIVTTKVKEDKSFSTELSVEKGGQLVFSQGPQGEVLVLMYACRSDEFKFHDDYIVYKIYASPLKITRRTLHRIVRFYFRFIYVSSYLGQVNSIDRIRIAYIKWRSKFDILKVGKSTFDVIKSVIELKSGLTG